MHINRQDSVISSFEWDSLQKRDLLPRVRSLSLSLSPARVHLVAFISLLYDFVLGAFFKGNIVALSDTRSRHHEWGKSLIQEGHRYLAGCNH